MNEYELIVLKKLWQIAGGERSKYVRLRKALSAYLVDHLGYSHSTIGQLLIQKKTKRYNLSVPLAAQLRHFLNTKIEEANKNLQPKDQLEKIVDLTELIQREVLVA